MEKNSDREVSELLKQLEEFVEKDQADKSAKIKSGKKSPDFSVEELLDQFKNRNIEGDNSSDADNQGVANEYDIAADMEGFISAEETADTGFDDASEDVSITDDTILVHENELEEVDAVVEDSAPDISSEIEEAEVVFEKPETGEKISAENVDTPLLEDVNHADGEGDEILPVESAEEESLRRQVEAFVLDTLDPEEEVSILDSIEDVVARNKMAGSENSASNNDSDIESRVDIPSVSIEPPKEIEELPCDYVENGMMDRFFKKDTSAFDLNEEESLDFDYKDFNDVDLNLALTLGYEQELHEAFGYSRVRASKNGFHDPAEEVVVNSSAFAQEGKEYRSHDQTEGIKLHYKKEKKNLYKRFAFAFVLTVFTLFFEHIFLADISIPYITDFFAVSWRYYAASILLTVLCISCCAKQLIGGSLAIFSMTPNPYTPTAAFAFLNLLYEIIVLAVYPEQGWLTYNFVLSIFLLFAIANEYMRLMRESMTFDVVSDGKPKLSLERFEGEGELKRDGSYLGRHDFFVEKISFVGNYFSRSSKIPMRQRVYGFGFVSILLIGVAMMLVSAYLSKDLGTAFQTFFFWLMLCVPMQYLVLGIYPFYLLSKGLKKLDSAILGEAVIDEYAITDTIYLGDDEMFGNHGASISGLRLYGDMDFYELLYYAFAVFSHLGAPLCHVFDTSTKEIPKPQEVKINTVSVGGIEATVDGEHKVLVGNIAFIRSKGFFPKRNLDDEKKVESGQTSIVYIAVNGTLCAKLYIKYTVTKRFEKFVQEMISNDISVGIRSLDPSVNARMISILREHREPEIEVIHPTADELVAIGKHSDSGIVTGRNSHMIFRILQQCLHIQNVHKKQIVLYLISVLMGVGGVVTLMLTNSFTMVPPLFIGVFHIVWAIIGMIYTKSKLK